VPRPKIHPPHLEDVLVQGHTCLGKVGNTKETLLNRVEVWEGGPENIFAGLLQFTDSRSGYIAARTGIPKQSVGFWLIDKTLTGIEQRQKIRYHTAGHSLKIAYVGAAEPVARLTVGTLLRVSLSRWWQPYDSPDVEERCYLQLSGWY